MIVIVCVVARLWDVTISIDKRGMPGWCRDAAPPWTCNPDPMPAAQVRPRLPERMVAMEGQPGSLPGLCEDGDDGCIFGGGDADLRRRTPTRGCRPWRRCVPTGCGWFDGGDADLRRRTPTRGCRPWRRCVPTGCGWFDGGDADLRRRTPTRGCQPWRRCVPTGCGWFDGGGRGLAPQDSHEGLPALAALRPYITTAFSAMGSGLNH